MEIYEIKPYLEAMLMAADRPVSLRALAESLDTNEALVEAALEEFEEDLISVDRGVQVRHRAGSVQLEMKPQFSDRIGRLLPERKEKPLSAQALETLAIIALKEPISLTEIEDIRGVKSVGTLQTLRDRKLIARRNKLSTERRKLWQTTRLFLDTFGLSSLAEIRNDGRMGSAFY